MPITNHTTPMECLIGRGYLKTYDTYVGIYLFPDVVSVKVNAAAAAAC